MRCDKKDKYRAENFKIHIYTIYVINVVSSCFDMDLSDYHRYLLHFL